MVKILVEANWHALSQFDHDSKTCKNYMSCINCKGHHFAYSRECMRWQMEKWVQQVRVEKHLSFYDARKLVETSQPATVATSYADVVKTTTRNVSVNTEQRGVNTKLRLNNFIQKHNWKKPIQKQRGVAPKRSFRCYNVSDVLGFR